MLESAVLVARHCAHLRYLNRRPSTIGKRAWTLGQLAEVESDLLAVTPALLGEFVARPSWGVEARANAVCHLRGFYRWAVEVELLEVDPTAGLQKPRRPRGLPRPMRDENVARALNIAGDPIRQWLYLAAYAGLRACEIAPLRGRDILFAADRPVILIREEKGGEPGTVPIGAPLRAIAAELALHGDAWCFPRGEGDPAKRGFDGHVTASQVSRRSNVFLHEAGVPESLHQLRHWYGTKVYAASGKDLLVTKRLMRHRSTDSTVRYSEIAPGAEAMALDALPRLAS